MWVPSLRSVLTVALGTLLVVVGELAYFWFAVLVPGIDC